MSRCLIAALTLLSLSVAPAAAAVAAVAVEPSEALLREAAELRDLALAESDAWRHAASLTTEVGPRFAGSSGDRAAVAWALAYLDGLGFDTVIPQTVTVPAWERGEAELRITAPWPQPLVGVSLGLSIGTPADGIEAPVVRFESVAALEAATSATVRGHIVFIDEKMERTLDGSGYSAAVAKRSRGPSVASERGAVATVIRSVGTSSERFAHTGTTRFAEGVRPIPAFALAAPDADMLARQVATGRDVLLHLHSTARQLPPARSANVIADIQGTTRPEEIVILGAHLDSWDLATGAQDNASGVAIVLEVARLIAARERGPARTVRVVLYANEEAGLDGSRAYTAAALETGLRHVIGLEADSGAGRVYEFSSGVGEAALPTIEAMHGVLAPLGIAAGDNATRGGADLSTLRDAGMPLLRLLHDMSEYFDVHHTINDTLDKIDPEMLRQAVAAYAAVTWIAANVEGDFGQYPVPVAPVDPAASGN